MHTYIHYIAIY